MRQKQALAIMMSGANVFLTGAPGAGKTYVLNEFVGRAMRAGKRVAVTASTGIAATHLGGTTIHSWSGLGIKDRLTDDDRRWLEGNDRLIKRYNSADVLVIDEVSMLHGGRLDMVNEAAKILRKNESAFGGLQVILVGDLFQLPPISRGGEAIDFAHLSAAWSELELSVCYITEQHRQSGHDALLGLLEAMRRGELQEEHEYLIKEQLGRATDDSRAVTRLYSHNIDVDAINERHLRALPGESQSYEMQTKGSKARIEQLVKSVLSPAKLTLKVGAEVIFVANNFAEGFVNGSRGTIVDMETDAVSVQLLASGRKLRVVPHSWSINEDGRVRAEVSQLPLRLAWAITIHKSQGMSLDAAEIDLSKAFTPGMGYVALSRLRSIDGLYLLGINQMALALQPLVFSYDAELRETSRELAVTTADIEDEVIAAVASSIVDEALYEKLKKWRFSRSQADKLPAFMIAHNTTLSALAAQKPQTPGQLLGVPGFGNRKAEAYGPEVLAIITNHESNPT